MLSFSDFNNLKEGSLIRSVQRGVHLFRIQKEPHLHIYKGEKRSVIYVSCLSNPKQKPLYLSFTEMKFFNKEEEKCNNI